MKKILLGLLVLGLVATAVSIPAHAQDKGKMQDVQVQQGIPDSVDIAQEQGMEEAEDFSERQDNESEMNGSEMNQSRSVERGPPEKAEGPIRRGPPAFVMDLMPDHVLDRVPDFFWN